MFRYLVVGLLAVFMAGGAYAEPSGKGKGEGKDATLFVRDSTGEVIGPVIWLGTTWAVVGFAFEGDTYPLNVTPGGVFTENSFLAFDGLNCGGQAYVLHPDFAEAWAGPDKNPSVLGNSLKIEQKESKLIGQQQEK